MSRDTFRNNDSSAEHLIINEGPPVVSSDLSDNYRKESTDSRPTSDLSVSSYPYWIIRTTFIFFFLVNLLNYADRGIIPGAPQNIKEFIQDTVGKDNPDLKLDVYYGMLQSAFIIGFSLACLIFGYIVHFYNPFRLIFAGLLIWCIATFMSGISKSLGSYEFLLVARMLSGVGEASFQCIAPPFISDFGGQAAARWLGAFYSAIPVGTALGYSYGAFMASSSLGWGWAFYMEGMVMFPLACIFLFLPFKSWSLKKGKGKTLDDEIKEKMEQIQHQLHDSEEDNDQVEDALLAEYVQQNDPEQIEISEITEKAEKGGILPCIFNNAYIKEILNLFKSPIYALTVLGYSSNTGVLIGIGTFSSGVLIEMGLFNSQKESSTIFGGLLAIVGILGTPIGGAILDVYQFDTLEEKLVYTTFCNFLWACGGFLFMCAGCMFTSPVIFIALLCVGAFSLFSCSAGINLAEMMSISPESRSLGLAISTLCIHIFGDVPSPLIVGYLLDKLAPACVDDLKNFQDDDNSNLNTTTLLSPSSSSSISSFFPISSTLTSSDTEVDAESAEVSEECKEQLPKVRLTYFITSAYLIVMVISFFAAWRIAKKKKDEKIAFLDKEKKVLNSSRHSITLFTDEDKHDIIQESDQQTPLLSNNKHKNASIN